MHILVDKNVTKKNYESLKNEIKKCLENYDIHHSTLEIEYEDCEESSCS